MRDVCWEKNKFFKFYTIRKLVLVLVVWKIIVVFVSRYKGLDISDEDVFEMGCIVLFIVKIV